jgi:putative ABC transport system ATP-binding protein
MALPPPPPIIHASGLTKAYRRAGGRVEALRGVDLVVEAGEFLMVMGPSGGGKSTLLNLIGGLDRADGGTLAVAGSDLTTASERALDAFRRTTVGFVFQFFNLLPTLDARDNVAIALVARGEGWDESRRRASEILGEVGLDHRADHRPGELSGGEQQRVAIARAVAGAPPLLLADEPTGDVDGETTAAIMNVLAALNRSRGVTVVMVTHDTSLTGYATRHLELRDGRIS